MGDIAQHFDRVNFECHCGCGYDDVDPRVVRIVEDVRMHFNSPTVINSGCRCLAWNRKQGSKDTSQHVMGKAADIAVKGVAPKDVADYLESKEGFIGGLGRYNNFTHVDVRNKNARWGKN